MKLAKDGEGDMGKEDIGEGAIKTEVADDYQGDDDPSDEDPNVVPYITNFFADDKLDSSSLMKPCYGLSLWRSRA